ncbi:SgcJ/EcaC family oxidoreductase [Bradyrhizobium sp. OAE829]|uniref:SgcJ/EcaC family oxidoreductase n=1 Tax=Bradyrhizobium sp. OAE829 TaxID=2663807 RepID=UPI00178A3938
MRLFLYEFILMASISTAAADSKTDALQIIDRWAKAFTASDVDAIVKLYAPDALFMGTGSKAVVTKPEGIRTYFEAALLNNRPRGATLNSYESMVLSDNAVLVTGLDTTTRVKDGTPISASGRVTFVVAKRGADWQIVHFHRSAMPQ